MENCVENTEFDYLAVSLLALKHAWACIMKLIKIKLKTCWILGALLMSLSFFLLILVSNSWQENLYAFKDDEQIFLELNYFWVLNLYHEKKKSWNCWERKKGKQVRKEERNLFTQVLIYSSVIIKSVSCSSVKLHFIRLTKQRGKLNLSYPTEGGFCHSPAACFCPGTASSLCCWAVIPVWWIWLI